MLRSGCLASATFGVSLRQAALWPVKAALTIGGALRGLARRGGPEGCAFLVYHAVSGRWPLELDLPPELFRRQMHYLARSGRVVGYEEAVAALAGWGTGDGLRSPVSPGFVLTFDDGYEDFYTGVYPLLRELGLPAILFVCTGFVEEGVPYPVLGRGLAEVRPVTWEMLGEMAASGLVTIGAHTHTHGESASPRPSVPHPPSPVPSQVEEDLERSAELFRRRLSLQPAAFAYPRGAWDPGIEAIIARRYRSAVLGGGRWATAAGFHPLRIPRVPIRRSDGWPFFLAKTRGWLQGEESFYQALRKLHGRRT